GGLCRKRRPQVLSRLDVRVVGCNRRSKRGDRVGQLAKVLVNEPEVVVGLVVFRVQDDRAAQVVKPSGRLASGGKQAPQVFVAHRRGVVEPQGRSQRGLRFILSAEFEQQGTQVRVDLGLLG